MTEQKKRRDSKYIHSKFAITSCDQQKFYLDEDIVRDCTFISSLLEDYCECELKFNSKIINDFISAYYTKDTNELDRLYEICKYLGHNHKKTEKKIEAKIKYIANHKTNGLIAEGYNKEEVYFLTRCYILKHTTTYVINDSDKFYMYGLRQKDYFNFITSVPFEERAEESRKFYDESKRDSAFFSQVSINEFPI